MNPTNVVPAHTVNEELSKLMTALAAGELPEVAEQIKAEAARRWLREPGHGYSDEAQRIKMEKAAAKRARRSRTPSKPKVVYDSDGSNNGFYTQLDDSLREREGRD